MFSNGHWALSFCTKDGYPSRSAREVTNWWQFFAIVKYFCNRLIVKLFAVSWLRLTSIWVGRGGCIRSKTKTLASKVKHFWEGKIKTKEAKSLSEHGKFREKSPNIFWDILTYLSSACMYSADTISWWYRVCTSCTIHGSESASPTPCLQGVQQSNERSHLWKKWNRWGLTSRQLFICVRVLV